MVTTPARAAVWTANMLLFSAVLQLGLLLPMAETFHRVTYAGIGLNALAIPVMTLVLAFALPTTLLGARLHALAVWPAKALALVMKGLFALTDFPNLPHWLSYRVPSPPEWVAWGFALSIVAAAWALGRQRRVFWGSLGASGAFAILISLHPFRPHLLAGALEVTALDCGGGDGVFVVLPDGTTMLVGACGRSGSARAGFGKRRWDPGEEIVSPYLWRRGVKKLDVLVLAGSNGTHLDGTAAVLENFSVGELWQGAAPRGTGERPTAYRTGRANDSAAESTPPYEALLAKVRERRIPVRELTAGDVFPLGGASVRVLWPAASLPAANAADGSSPRTRSRRSRDDDSLVLRISIASSSVLLPGDIDERVEQELVRSPIPLASEALKVARHGARTSSGSAFLARVSPRIAILSAESGSPRSSPSPETLERIRAAGARIFRTDTDGAVTVEMRGASLSVHTFAPDGQGDLYLPSH